MTIGELAAESGLPASTIRSWERIGVLPKPPRVSGQRRYTGNAVQRLAVLRLAQASIFAWMRCAIFCMASRPGLNRRGGGRNSPAVSRELMNKLRD